MGRPRKEPGTLTKREAEKKGSEDWKGLDTAPGDTAKYLQHELTSWDMPAIDTKDDKQVEDRIHWYFELCQANDIRPSVSGICCALDVTRRTWYMWCNGETRTNTNIPNIVRKANNVLQALWEDYMINNKIYPVSGIFLGKNHFGFDDKSEVVLSPSQPLGDDNKSQKQLEEQYKETIVDFEDGEKTTEDKKKKANK